MKLPGASLLTRDEGKRWGHSDWDKLVRAATENAKLPAGVCLYALRHSFITQIEHGREAIERLCGEDPAAYIRTIVTLMPKPIEQQANPFDEMDDNDLTTLLELFRLLRERREASAIGASDSSKSS